MVHKVIIENSLKYLLEKGIRLQNDSSAEEYKIKIVRNTREHKNELYADNDAVWYKKSLNAHDLHTYIRYLLTTKSIYDLKVRLGIRDRYFGYFRKIKDFRKHYKKLKALCNQIKEKYRNTPTFESIKFRVRQEENRDIISLEGGVREKLTLDTNFTDMVKLDKILIEANETLRYYAEIGKLEI